MSKTVKEILEGGHKQTVVLEPSSVRRINKLKMQRGFGMVPDSVIINELLSTFDLEEDGLLADCMERMKEEAQA